MLNDAPGAGEFAILAGLIVGEREPIDFDDPDIMTELASVRDHIVLPALAASRSHLIEAADVDILVESPTAADAVACAVAIQNGMTARNAGRSDAARVRFRFGIDLQAEEGAAQSKAGAIAAFSDADDVWMNASVAAQVRDRIGSKLIDCGLRSIGPVGESIALCRLSPERPGNTLTAAPTQAPGFVQSSAEVREGAILNGTYRIDSLIAQGGMGEVFKGQEIHSGGVVAVKLLRREMSSNRVALGLFQKEAQILKEIYHDAIVRYFLFSFEQSLQRHYLAMEFVDGVSLSDLVKQRPMSFEDVCTLRQRVASALFVAHERGIIHRDISPDNIIVPGGNVARAKVIDFGIARAPEIGGGTLIGGGFAGKYNYVSPEQLGLAGGEITPKSDIYSLGLVLAECNLGKALDMDGTQAEVIEKRRTVPDLSRLDARLRPLVGQMLQPAPADRPPSMAAIANWPVSDHGSPLTPENRVEKPTPDRTAALAERRDGQRRRWLVGAAVLTVIFGAGGVVFYRDRFAQPSKLPTHTSPASGSAAQPPSPTETQAAKDANSPEKAGESGPTAVPDTPSADAQAAPPASTPSTQTSQTDAMAAFARDFTPSACFLVKPVQFTPSSALVEAFGLSRDDFAAFDRDFSSKFGFSPDVAGYRVWSKQCPALDFARHVPGSDDKNPILLLKSTRVGSGQTISGEIRNGGGATLTLLLVGEDGTVRNATDALKANGDALTFDLPNNARSNPVPQLLMILASGQPLNAISGGPAVADALFPALQGEIAAHPQSLRVDTKLFLLGG